MKHFINARDRMVSEALDGLLRSSGDRLARLDLYPDVRVVLRRDWEKDRVAVISGGGAGHEPAHPGFVGRGMLTAAVVGDVFASPSIDAVLAAIRAVTGPAGCLLIVKNYTGDRLNFGLAAERARAEGLNVRMLIVADDIAIPHLSQPRGIAGTLFVHKIAGHLAETGRTLDEVWERALAAASGIVSYGVSLSSAAIPGQPFEERIGPGEAEMGLGIHGETGAERIALTDASSIVAGIADRLFGRIDAGKPHALLINNLGGTSVLEMGVITNAVFGHAQLADAVELVCGPAPFMTSLNMNGFSLSLLPLDERVRTALLSPVWLPAWPGMNIVSPVRTVPAPGANGTGPAWPPSVDARARAILAAVCNRIISLESELNALDARAGDGDTGSTLAGGARAILADLDQLPLADPTALCLALGARISRAMGGSSGVLLSIFFTAAGGALRDGEPLATALASGLGRMQFYGGAAPGDRTMVDALSPALEALATGGIAAAANAARDGAESTARIGTARAGRSAYINAEALEGVPDPGAVAVAAAFEAAAAALDESQPAGARR